MVYHTSYHEWQLNNCALHRSIVSELPVVLTYLFADEFYLVSGLCLWKGLKNSDDWSSAVGAVQLLLVTFVVNPEDAGCTV